MQMEMNQLECHLYDVEANEIITPEGHAVVYGNNSFCFSKVNFYESKFVYQPERLNPEISNDLLKDKWIIDCRECDSLNSTNK